MAAIITGKIFSDLTQNGRYEPQNPVLAGVSVVLAGKALFRCTKSDENGDFRFSVETMGIYTLYLPATSPDGRRVPAVSLHSGGRPPSRGARAYLVTVTRTQLRDSVTLPAFDFGLLPEALPITTTLQNGVACGADVTVALSLQPDPPFVDGWLTCAITVSNAGPQPAMATRVACTLPQAITGARYCINGGAQWGVWGGTAELGTLEAGTSVTLFLVGRVVCSPTEGLICTASAASVTPDPNPDNNRTTVTAQVRNACTSSTGLLPFSYSREVLRRMNTTPVTPSMGSVAYTPAIATTAATNATNCAPNAVHTPTTQAQKCTTNGPRGQSNGTRGGCRTQNYRNGQQGANGCDPT